MAEYIFQIVGDCFDDKYISRADCARANKSRYTVNKSLAAPKLSRSLKHRASFSRGRTPRPDGNLQIFTFRIEGEKHNRSPVFCRRPVEKCCTREFLMSFISRSCNVCVLLKKIHLPIRPMRIVCLLLSFFKKIKYCVKIKYRFCPCFNIECSRTLSPTFIIGKLK